MLKEVLQERKITLPGSSYVWEGMENTEVVKYVSKQKNLPLAYTSLCHTVSLVPTAFRGHIFLLTWQVQCVLDKRGLHVSTEYSINLGIIFPIVFPFSHFVGIELPQFRNVPLRNLFC